jgi:hypothetical protein
MTKFGAVVLAGIMAIPSACTSPTTGDESDRQAMRPEKGPDALPGIWEGRVAQDNGIVQLHTVTFGSDGSFKGSLTYNGGAMAGPIERSGMWKVVKDEGNTLTVEVEFPVLMLKEQIPDKTIKTTYVVTFEGGNTILFSLDRPDAEPLRLILLR